MYIMLRFGYVGHRKFLVSIFVNEVLDRTEQIEDFARRLNYGFFVLNKNEQISFVKVKNSIVIMVVYFHMLTTVPTPGVVQLSATGTKF